MVRTNLSKLIPRAPGPESRGTVLVAVGFFLAALVMLEIGYSVDLVFNLYAAAASLFLFGALYLGLSEWLLKSTFARAYRYVRNPWGAAILVGYLAVHYLLYGFFLEKVLVGVYGFEAINVPATAYISSQLLGPPSIANAFLSVISFPSITLWFPPYFGVVLIPYGLFMGFLIGVLVVANLEIVHEISACPLGNRIRAAVFLPVAGVVSGASCCLSLPILLTVAVPATGALAYTAFASYFAFFAFPIVTAVALYANLYYTQNLIRSVPVPGKEAEAEVS